MAIDLEEELKKAGGNPAAAGGKPFGPNVPTLGQGLTGMPSTISGIGVSQEGLNRYANENKIRGEMIGAMSPSGGSGVYVLGEVAPGMTQNDVDNAEKTARWRRDDLMNKMKSGSPADKAALASIINNEMSVGAQLRGQDLSASSAARGHDLNVQAALRADGGTTISQSNEF